MKIRKVKLCIICGELNTRRKVKYCYQCGREHEVRVATEIRKREGPYYEKWKANWEAATGLKVKGGK